MNISSKLFASVVMSAGVLASGSAIAGEVEFWSPFTGPDGAAIGTLVSEFNDTIGAENDVKVNLLIIPWEQYYTKLSVSLASRTAPDLAVMHSHQIAGFAQKGALEAYTPEEIDQAGLVGDDYIAQLWAAGEVDGERYGIPIDAFPRHIYYNKTLFQEAGLDPDTPPATGEELRKDAQAIDALGDDINGLYFQTQGAGVARNFYALYWQYQDDLYNADYTDVAEGFADSAAKSLEDLKVFLDDGLAPSEEISDSSSLFAQNKIGITILQITDLPVYQTAAADQGLDFGVAPLPQFGPHPATFALGHNFVIPRATPEDARKDAMVFIKWIGDNSVAWTKTGKMPAKKTTLASAEFKALPEQEIIAKSLEYTHFPPPVSVQPEIDRVVQDTIEAYYANQIDTEQAVSMMADGIRTELAKQ